MPIHLSITIKAPPQAVFDAVTDLTSYSKWLPQSSAFKGTTKISDNPIKLGTTYIEDGPAGVRKGEVVEYDAPHQVTFHQPMSLKPYVFGLVLDVRVQMKFREDGGQTILDRDISLGVPWVLSIFKLVIENEFRRESWRTLELLKEYCENGGQ
ncbi:hypothetical protein EG329_011678 [Mollisiaceae sp. DMI_Dod_QoI]|nr:hypothetical protein EG329_011678 [Helotiales sp. DMI_Dod_QoI]